MLSGERGRERLLRTHHQCLVLYQAVVEARKKAETDQNN